MDRGYDSNEIHRLIREDLITDSIIPLRSWNNEVVGGTYRKEMVMRSNDPRYRKRLLVETKFSFLKRMFGGDLKARRFLMQMKEIANKMIVCNLHRSLRFLIVKVFYKADIPNYLRTSSRVVLRIPRFRIQFSGIGNFQRKKFEKGKSYRLIPIS